MSLRVCILLSEVDRWLTGHILSRCKNLTGIECLQANYLEDTQQEVCTMLKSADVVISNPSLIVSNLDNLNRVKWVHSVWAGVQPVIDQPTRPSFTLTRHVGSFGSQIADYTIAQIINREAHLLTAYRSQLQCRWSRELWKREELRLLSQLTIGIIGVGAIGSKVAELCKAHGMTVWGITRTEHPTKCPHVDHHRLLDSLPEVLANSDYVCNILPSTPHTAGLLNGEVLKSCSVKKSVLINVGRGDVVSEKVIVKAIREGWLGGAILDVFEQEPLPEDSELWRIPEVVITPHISALCIEDCADAFVSNLQLFLEGKELQHKVDWGRGY